MCDNKSLYGWCAAYQGDAFEGEGGDFYKDSCQVTVTSACPISDLIMVCVMSQGLPEEVATYYYSGAIGSESWQFDTEEKMFSICELNGGVVL